VLRKYRAKCAIGGFQGIRLDKGGKKLPDGGNFPPQAKIRPWLPS
jgi:hypothetical protein